MEFGNYFAVIYNRGSSGSNGLLEVCTIRTDYNHTAVKIDHIYRQSNDYSVAAIVEDGKIVVSYSEAAFLSAVFIRIF